MNIKKITSHVCFLSFFLSLSTFALKPEGPLALSMSGAGRAITKGAEYQLLNPASLIHFKGAQGSGFYTFGLKTQKPYWGLSIVENQQIPLGVSYIREWDSSDQYLSFSTAGFILPGWSVGLSLSRWQTSQTNKVIATSSKAENKASWNVQGGVLIRPQDSPLSIGATYDYILPLKGAFEEQRKWALAISLELYKWLAFRTDALYNIKSKWTLAGGATATISQFLILRLANRWHIKEKKWLFSGGLGLTAKNMALDYGLSQTKETKNWQHTISVRFAF